MVWVRLDPSTTEQHPHSTEDGPPGPPHADPRSTRTGPDLEGARTTVSLTVPRVPEAVSPPGALRAHVAGTALRPSGTGTVGLELERHVVDVRAPTHANKNPTSSQSLATTWTSSHSNASAHAALASPSNSRAKTAIHSAASVALTKPAN